MTEDENEAGPLGSAGAAQPAADGLQVRLKTAEGAEMGVTVTLGPAQAGDEADRAALARRITGWSTPFFVDGAEVPFSPENALALVNRFPWLREQLAATAGGKEA